MASIWMRESDGKKTDSEEDMEDIWDDTALIRAYEKAVSSFKNKDKEKIGGQKQQTKNKQKKKRKEKCMKTNISPEKDMQWRIGDKCQAVYYEDGLLYLGTIIDLNIKSRSCTIKFDYYGNIETVSLDDLYERQVDNSEENRVTDNDNHMDKHENSTVNNEWGIGDICKAWNENTKKDELAVITNISANTCNLTFIKTRSKTAVLLSSIRKAGKNDESAHNNCYWHQNVFKNQNRSTFPNCIPSPFMSSPDLFFQMFSPPFSTPPFFGFPNFSNSGTSPWKHNSMFLPPPPPPPLPFPADVDDENGDALASMLMSWYMVGYHTGFYQATKRSRNENDVRRNSDQMENSDITSDCSTKPDS